MNPPDNSDTIAYFLQDFGEPQNAYKVPPREAALFDGKLPEGLLKFWMEHGRGSYLDGKFWICDPAPFAGILQMIFDGDPEFSPSDMSVWAYTAFGNLAVWHTRRKRVTINFLSSYIDCPPESSFRENKIGKFFPDDFIMGNSLSILAESDPEMDDEWEELLPKVIKRLGLLEPGEVYGFFPPPCFGGTRDATALRRTPVIEHVSFLAQVCELQFVELTEPSPGNPFGELVPVRRPGAR